MVAQIILYALALGVGLSMDAAAVSMTNGMEDSKMRWPKMILIAGFYGFFQFLMPLVGYFIGSIFENFLIHFTAWLALILLGFIGGKMLIEGIKHKDDKEVNAKKLSVLELFIQAIATSIDALTVGLIFIGLGAKYQMDNNTFALIVSCIIGICTFVLSFISIKLGKIFGNLLANKAEIVGGIILIAIGLKTFIQYLIEIL